MTVRLSAGTWAESGMPTATHAIQAARYADRGRSPLVERTTEDDNTLAQVAWQAGPHNEARLGAAASPTGRARRDRSDVGLPLRRVLAFTDRVEALAERFHQIHDLERGVLDRRNHFRACDLGVDDRSQVFLILIAELGQIQVPL